MEQLFVIKVGGAVVEESGSLDSLLDSFAAIEGRKVLVHGGGREATRIAQRLGIETVMVDGRRVTDAAMLEVVTMVYAGKVNKNIVGGLRRRGIKAVGLTGADMNCITSVRRPAGEIDYGYVGDIVDVDVAALYSLLEMGVVPVMVPITSDKNGQLLNTNADSVASAVASALCVKYDVTLVSCFEKRGVLLDKDDENSVIPRIDKKRYAELLLQKAVSDGMIPKLDNAFSALDKGVKKVIVTSSEMLGSMDEGTTIVL